MVGRCSEMYLPPTPVRHIDTTVFWKTFHNTDNFWNAPSEQSLNISVISTEIDSDRHGGFEEFLKTSL